MRYSSILPLGMLSVLTDTGLSRRFSFDGANFLNLNLYTAELFGRTAAWLQPSQERAL